MLTPARGMVTRRRRSWTRVAQLVTGLALVAVATGCSDNTTCLLTGALRVFLMPEAVRAAGGRWMVDTNATQQVCGATVAGLAPGNHTVRFTPVDGYTTPPDQVVVIVAGQTTDATGTYVPVGPQAPVANAGADQTVQLPAGASLNGTATPNAATPAWTQVSGPAAAVFTDANAPVTTVTLPAIGVYIFRLTATNGTDTASDDVQVTATNQPLPAPVADAGADQDVQLPAGASLNGTATPNAATPAWTQVSGPAAAVFTNATAPVTTVTLPAAGDYVFRLTATNGTDTASDDVLVRAIAPVNGAPNVNAGADQGVAAGAAANLDGTVTDDGLPTPANLTTTWSQVSGPAGVTFGNASSVDTTANFPTAGVYVLRLTANDGAASASDEVQITVTFAVRTMYVEPVAGAAGSEVTVQVMLSDVSNVGGFKAALRWDTSQLSLVAGSVAAGTALNGKALANVNTSTPGELIVNHTDTAQYAATGQLVTMRFTIAGGLTRGTALPITLLSEASPSVKRCLVYLLTAVTEVPALASGNVIVS